jgi:hypothetical protein
MRLDKLFLSYARADDSGFVSRLYDDLIQLGYEVWWDKMSMPSRALKFLQEIRDAIDDTDRLILVVGIHALESAYVRAEWEYALSICKVVTPILRNGEYEQLPEPLVGFHSIDFREPRLYDDAFQELVRALSVPILPLGKLRNVPHLPPHFVSRPHYLRTLIGQVMADLNQPTVMTDAQRITVIQGMGGIGKSVLATAFALICESRRAFKDGIVWINIGQKPNLLTAMQLIGKMFDDELHHYTEIAKARLRLTDLLGDKLCLLILDDVWNLEDIEVFRSVLGHRCRMLITTRDASLISSLDAQECSLDTFEFSDSMALLSDWSGDSVLPTEAQHVIRECGNLPLALALCGAMRRDGALWSDLLDALRQADLSFIEKQIPSYPYSTIMRAIKVSVDTLQHDQASRYQELAVFPEDREIPESVVCRLWGQTANCTLRYVRWLLSHLERKGLVRLEGEESSRRVRLHDLQHDYLRMALAHLDGLHNELLMAYNPERMPWYQIPDDGYLYYTLAYHLREAGRREEASMLLLTAPKWLKQITILPAHEELIVTLFDEYRKDDPVKGRTFLKDWFDRENNPFIKNLLVRCAFESEYDELLMEAIEDRIEVVSSEAAACLYYLYIDNPAKALSLLNSLQHRLTWFGLPKVIRIRRLIEVLVMIFIYEEKRQLGQSNPNRDQLLRFIVETLRTGTFMNAGFLGRWLRKGVSQVLAQLVITKMQSQSEDSDTVANVNEFDAFFTHIRRADAPVRKILPYLDREFGRLDSVKQDVIAVYDLRSYKDSTINFIPPIIAGKIITIHGIRNPESVRPIVESALSISDLRLQEERHIHFIGVMREILIRQSTIDPEWLDLARQTTQAYYEHKQVDYGLVRSSLGTYEYFPLAWYCQIWNRCYPHKEVDLLSSYLSRCDSENNNAFRTHILRGFCDPRVDFSTCTPFLNSVYPYLDSDDGKTRELAVRTFGRFRIRHQSTVDPFLAQRVTPDVFSAVRNASRAESLQRVIIGGLGDAIVSWLAYASSEDVRWIFRGIEAALKQASSREALAAMLDVYMMSLEGSGK